MLLITLPRYTDSPLLSSATSLLGQDQGGQNQRPSHAAVQGCLMKCPQDGRALSARWELCVQDNHGEEKEKHGVSNTEDVKLQGGEMAGG